MTCPCKQSCPHQKAGLCGLSEAERVSLKNDVRKGPKDGDGGIPGG